MKPQAVKMSRRDLVVGALSAATAACVQQGGGSGAYPSRDLTFIIPNAAGGSNDLYGRLLSQALGRRVGGQSVVPLNVASGGGGKGIMQLFRAPADGYTIGILSVPGIFMLQHIRRLPEDFGRFTWLCSLTSGESYGLAVPGTSPMQDMDDLQALSRKRPVKFGATGPESTAYSATVVSARLLNLRSRIVSGYRGSIDYIMGSIRGDTDAVVAPLAAIKAMQGSTEMRLLASFEAKSSYPGVPGAISLGQPDLASITVKRVLAGPPAMAEPITGFLSEALLQCAHDKTVQDYAHRLGEEMSPQGPAQTGEFVKEQQRFVARWQSVLKVS